MKLIGYREGNYGEKQEPARKKKLPKFARWAVWNVILRAGVRFAQGVVVVILRGRFSKVKVLDF